MCVIEKKTLDIFKCQRIGDEMQDIKRLNGTSICWGRVIGVYDVL